MTKIVKCMAIFLLVCAGCSAFPFKKSNGSKQVYVLGVSVCFSDTVVYMTDVQRVEGAKINDKFLMSREEYSAQLSNYLQQQDGKRSHTSATFFDSKRERLLKKAAKLTKKYTRAANTELRTLTRAEFTFEKPADEEEEEYTE